MRLLAEHESAIFGYILSLLPNWQDAQDVYQETSVVLWRKFDAFEKGTSFIRWACAAARFNVLNKMKKRGRERYVFSNELLDAMADESLEEIERLEAERQALHVCLQKLPESDHAMVKQCYTPGHSIKKVAQTLNKTPNSVYKWLNRIRGGLLQCIERRLAQEGYS
ncbi:MAG: sigma-70 family RNA polymerase sigma factor [Verrucomicrobiota bacterium]